jgi:hypothetical protein
MHAYGVARSRPPRRLATDPEEGMAGDRSFNEGPRRGPTRGANGSATQGPLLPGWQVRISRADREDKDRDNGEMLRYVISFGVCRA